MLVNPLQRRLFLPLVCFVAITAAMRATAYDCVSMPVPYTAHYAVTRNDHPGGSMQVVLERKDDDTFDYSMETQARWGIFTAHVEQHSVFSFKDGLEWPKRYRATQKVSLFKRSESVDFDWRSFTVSGSKSRKSWVLKLSPGMQDKLTVYLALARALCEGRDSISISVVSGSGPKQHEYIAQEHESQDPLTAESGLVHIRRGSPDEEKQTDLWMSEATRFLPVRIVYRDKDVITDMQLTYISFETD